MILLVFCGRWISDWSCSIVAHHTVCNEEPLNPNIRSRQTNTDQSAALSWWCLLLNNCYWVILLTVNRLRSLRLNAMNCRLWHKQTLKLLQPDLLRFAVLNTDWFSRYDFKKQKLINARVIIKSYRTCIQSSTEYSTSV